MVAMIRPQSCRGVMRWVMYASHRDSRALNDHLIHGELVIRITASGELQVEAKSVQLEELLVRPGALSPLNPNTPAILKRARPLRHHSSFAALFFNALERAPTTFGGRIAVAFKLTILPGGPGISCLASSHSSRLGWCC